MDKLLNQRTFLIVIGLTAIICLAYAYISQYLFAVNPCQLCYYERICYWTLAAIGGTAIIAPQWQSFLYKATLPVLLAGVALGVYHLGVEWHWWKGTVGCSSINARSLSLEDFKEQLMAKPAARCDQVNWVVLGISATIWNLLWYVGFLGLWLLTAGYQCCRRKTQHP